MKDQDWNGQTNRVVIEVVSYNLHGPGEAPARRELPVAQRVEQRAA
jgi:hypothetical protein